MHISLGASSEPVSLMSPVTTYGFFITTILTQPHLRQTKLSHTFLYVPSIDSYIRKFVSLLCIANNSHHGYFIETISITDTFHLWNGFEHNYLTIFLYIVHFNYCFVVYFHRQPTNSYSNYLSVCCPQLFTLLPTHLLLQQLTSRKEY